MHLLSIWGVYNSEVQLAVLGWNKIIIRSIGISAGSQHFIFDVGVYWTANVKVNYGAETDTKDTVNF